MMSRDVPRSPRLLASQVAILEEEEEEGCDGNGKPELFSQEDKTNKMDPNVSEYTEVKAFNLSSSSGSSVGVTKSVARSWSEGASGGGNGGAHGVSSASSLLQRKARSQSEHTKKSDDSRVSNESYDSVDFNLVSFSGNNSSSELGDLPSRQGEKNIVSEKRKKKRKLTPLIKVGERLRGKKYISGSNICSYSSPFIAIPCQVIMGKRRDF